MRRLLPLLFATASLVLMAGCYETGELRVRSVGALSAGDSCSDFAKQVFIDAGYERLTSVSGADMFFSPRAHTNTGLSLLWGIAVSTGRRSIGNDPTERCVFELEAIALEEGCGIQCPMTPIRDPDTDAAVKEMARRLAGAAPTSR